MVDQQTITHRINYASMRTGEQFFKVLAFLAQEAYNKVQNRELKGEQDVKDFLEKTKERSDYKIFNNSELNLTKLRDYLKRYGVTFAFEDNKDGTQTLWFKAKDDNVLKRAMEKAKEDILTDPKKMTDQLGKKADDLTVNEQIAKHKVTLSKTAKQMPKTKGRGL